MTSSALEVPHRLGPYQLTAATDFGPRIVGLKYDDSPEILVELSPDVVIVTENVGTYRFHGGHRLWVSPEVPEITYAPDDHRCLVTTDTDRLTVVAPVDSSGFGKELDLHWDGRRLVVDHVIRWSGEEPTQAAPWAITQLPLGGTAVVPIPRTAAVTDLQSDASLILWPYTRLDDPRISWRERTALMRAEPGSPTKLGSGPSPGGVGYLRDGYLFVKHFQGIDGTLYPDRGAVAQVYVGEHFCEVESVGSLTTLEPGSTARHREVWEVSVCPDIESALAAAQRWGLE